MAEILNEFPAHLRQGIKGKPPKYQEEWFDGRARKLNYYIDLQTYSDMNSARTSLYTQAKRRNMRALIAQQGDNLYFQVVDLEVTP
jgi:hypothetical protein